MAWRPLTDAQWEQIRPHLPVAKRLPHGGRPPADARGCLEGILWILWTGAPWSELPNQYGSPSTCWRRLREWEATGGCSLCGGPFWLSSMINSNSAETSASWRELRTGEKGGLKVGPTKRGKGTKWMVLVDGAGTPLGADVDAASPAEVRLLEATLDTVAVTHRHRPGRPRKRPDRLITDRGYDSHATRALLVRRGIEPIIPARVTNQRATRMGDGCAAIDTAGSWSARLAGWATSGA